MPTVKLTSQHTRPDSIFIHDWIKPLLDENCQGLLRPIYRAIPPINNTNVRNPLSSRPSLLTTKVKCHFTKIVKFYKVENFKIFASIRDTRFQILVEFTPHCVSTFERTNRCRLTSDTTNCTLLIGDCSIEYKSSHEISQNYRLNFPNKRLLPVLTINQASILDRDQATLLEQFPFVYSTY
ncbi:hypothetical protein KAFR_0L00480 [Kazachstania africana CBS 2517]|uniref:Telomere replication protein EST3 n=1 Tax=Kazachstania africana (strain ATCC 22294 / BCRC 22015 / CBS 2517 / CECT 1963 / NBRC 1671 / NRRL Y-8276) TaxID=1071382 RepID=H2B205_KAZAF|nr:LOW QUALITY PROTEIN: hypothetical protein KAFR_0L00480 [Kazachstania africana CBS 2517]CCF60655.1 hypothetical protein KAFR_0L00480 [Kazachstania africana CBS 2517]